MSGSTLLTPFVATAASLAGITSAPTDGVVISISSVPTVVVPGIPESTFPSSVFFSFLSLDVVAVGFVFLVVTPALEVAGDAFLTGPAAVAFFVFVSPPVDLAAVGLTGLVGEVEEVRFFSADDVAVVGRDVDAGFLAAPVVVVGLVAPLTGLVVFVLVATVDDAAVVVFFGAAAPVSGLSLTVDLGEAVVFGFFGPVVVAGGFLLVKGLLAGTLVPATFVPPGFFVVVVVFVPGAGTVLVVLSVEGFLTVVDVDVGGV